MTFTATLLRHTLTRTFVSLMYISLLVYSIEQSTFCFLRLCPHISDNKDEVPIRDTCSGYE
jgi:hypothetical protein